MADKRRQRGSELPRGRHGLPPEVVVASQRKRIIDAMIEVVAERGYADARVADVIEVAGVSRKTFYELFADKEDGFLAAYDEVSSEVLARTTAAYESNPEAEWPERLRLAIEAMLDYYATHPAAARLAIVESLAAGPKALARRDAALREFTHLIDAGRAESSLDLPGITALTLIGGVEELLYTEIINGAVKQVPARLPEILFCLLHPFVGTERATAERDRARRLVREVPPLTAIDGGGEGVPPGRGPGPGRPQIRAAPANGDTAAAPPSPAG